MQSCGVCTLVCMNMHTEHTACSYRKSQMTSPVDAIAWRDHTRLTASFRQVSELPPGSFSICTPAFSSPSIKPTITTSIRKHFRQDTQFPRVIWPEACAPKEKLYKLQAISHKQQPWVFVSNVHHATSGSCEYSCGRENPRAIFFCECKPLIISRTLPCCSQCISNSVHTTPRNATTGK